jgi:hypothetical protein
MKADKKPVRTHTFNGVRYRIIVKSLDGMCVNSSKGEDDHELYIFDIRDKDGLITAIHEAMHASDFNMSEKKVDRMSKEIGRFLWRLGFRWSP